MELDYQAVMNDPVMWVLCIPAVAATVLQALLFYRRAKKTGPLVGLSLEEASKAFKIGLTAAIGPAVSGAIVMLSMMTAVGGAFTWLRLSFIGSASTELAAATLGAQASGQELGGTNYDMLGFSTSIWACTLNSFGWLFVTGVFTPRLASIKQKLVGNDNKLLGIVSAAAMVGCFSFLSMGEILKGSVNVYVFMFSAALMGLLIYISNKQPWIKEHLLSIVLIAGLIFACAVNNFQV